VPSFSAKDVSSLLEEFLVRLMTMCEGESMNHFADMDLSLPQVRILFALSERAAPVPINEVAQSVGLSLATTGRNLDRLVHEGLAVRQEDVDDRRVKLVALSDAGNHMLTHHLDFRRDGLRAFAERMSPSERQGLQAALTPILAGSSLRATKQGNS
jgi:DNA-binding MarR family transcriptional regulator